MNIQILELVEGARRAEGLTVVIDVFRAFSLEAYLTARGAQKIIPVGNIDTAYEMKRADPAILLVGERGGKMCEGFDFGNSPSQTDDAMLDGKTIVHTTSAGTQGIANAMRADEIITGALVNAKAIAQYIKSKAPEKVSLVAMGEGGRARANEDVLCAKYIRSMLLGEKFDIDGEIDKLRYDGGQKFFVPETQDIFPEKDYWLCIKRDIFPFVLRVTRSADGSFNSTRINVQ